MAFKTSVQLFGDGTGPNPFVPYATTNAPGTAAANRGIQFGEQLTAAIANRTHYALALNDEDLNTRLSVFETGGLDAAYDNGAVGPVGGGREITKDGGAVETTSSLAAQYADDVANAHYRANALGDTTSGGGFDFRGLASALPAYGFMSRVNATPSVSYTTMGVSEAVTLNPGGAGGDVVRFTGVVHDGTNTDVGLNAVDFLEITGAGAASGLYRVFSLGPTINDFRVRQLSGAAPVFGVSVAATSKFFIANMMSSSLGASGMRAGLALGADSAMSTILALFGRDIDGINNTGPVSALSFYHQDSEGVTSSRAQFTTTGRLKSSVNSDALGTASARAIERDEAGIPNVSINKAEGGATGFHEIGMLVREEGQLSTSWTGLETRGLITETTALGVNASINGTFAAPMGRIILPDSDGAPAAPTGQLKSLWGLLVQPGACLVKILTGAGADRHYLLSAVNFTAAGAVPDEIVVTHIDGGALDVAELPTAGNLTFQFIQRQDFGGKLPPIVVDTAPASLPAITDVTASTWLSAPTETTGDDNGLAALVVRGRLFGARTVNPGVVFPVTAHLDIPWSIGWEGDFYTQGEVIADALVQGQQIRSDTGVSLISSGDFTYEFTNDVAYYLPPISGISQIDAGGDNPEWRFDYVTGEWECISVALGGRLWFPLLVRGELRSVAWVSQNAGALATQDIALITETQDELAPFGKTVGASGVTSNGLGLLVQRNTVNFNTALTQDTKDYYLRIQGATVGDRIRSLKVTIRKTRAGDGW